MARPYRLRSENCLYHIMSRGDDRKRIYTGSRDYEKFMGYVIQAKERYRFYLYAYCLMPNHFHLLLETRLPNISAIMHYIKGAYTVFYNLRHQRCGHLFQGRFKSIVVDKDAYFLELSRYIHLNPVRTGIVAEPHEYHWSSYHGYTGGKDAYIDIEQVKGYLNKNHDDYRRFVLEGIRNPCNPMRDVYAGFLLGSTPFIKVRLKDLSRQVTSDDIAHKTAMQDDKARSEAIIVAVTHHFRVALDELKSCRTRPFRARQILVYLLRKYTGLTNREIGEVVGMRFSAVSKAGLQIERLMAVDKKINFDVKKIISNFEG